MNFLQLTLKNISGTAYRSWVIGLCAFVLAGFTVGTTLVMRGAETSLRLAMDRLGADIVVVPQGSEMKAETALLMGKPSAIWMPASTQQKLAVVPGVALTSPQLFLSTLNDAPCCSVSDMFLVAFDPATDFTIQPWLKQQTGKGLGLGQAVGGHFVFTPAGEQNIKLYNYFVTLVANIEETGTGLDQSMFVTFDTAQDMARISVSQAKQPLVIPQESISAVMVKVSAGTDPKQVALKIIQQVPGVTPIASTNLFQSYRRQMNGLLNILMFILAFTWILATVLIGLVFTMAANERKRELGVLRALGATRLFVIQALLSEAGALAIGGGLAGIALSALCVGLFRLLIIDLLGVPFLFPSLVPLIGQISLGLGASLLCVTLAALIPAVRISRQEPALAMRE
jgi:putative ABC transport system permease protein